MSAILVAALLCPFLLIAVGLLVGRALRRGDQLQDGSRLRRSSTRGPAARGDVDSRQLPATLPGTGGS